MADYLARRKYGNDIAIFATERSYEKRQIYSGATTILSPSVCLVCRVVARVADERHGQTHRTTTVTLAAHARRGLMINDHNTW